MRRLRLRALLLTMLAATAGGLVLSPAPASAAEACRPGWLCLYKDTGFNNMAFTTQRHGNCWRLDNYGISNVGSYWNNLTVYVDFFDLSGDDNVWSIRPGGSSSNANSFTDEHIVCTR